MPPWSAAIRRSVASTSLAMPVASPLPEAVLDVDLLGLVAGKGDVHAGQRTLGHGLLPLELVEEVVGEAALAGEQPALALVAALAPVLDEGAERGNAGAGADHDDRGVTRLGRAEVAVGAPGDDELRAPRPEVGEQA